MSTTEACARAKEAQRSTDGSADKLVHCSSEPFSFLYLAVVTELSLLSAECFLSTFNAQIFVCSSCRQSDGMSSICVLLQLPPISLFMLNENVLAVFNAAAHMNKKRSQLAPSLLLIYREQKCTDGVWPEQPCLSQVNPLRNKSLGCFFFHYPPISLMGNKA